MECDSSHDGGKPGPRGAFVYERDWTFQQGAERWVIPATDIDQLAVGQTAVGEAAGVACLLGFEEVADDKDARSGRDRGDRLAQADLAAQAAGEAAGGR